MKKIGGIISCEECPLRVRREVLSHDWRDLCVGIKNGLSVIDELYFSYIHGMGIGGMELTDLSIIHPNCPLEDDIIIKVGDIE